MLVEQTDTLYQHLPNDDALTEDLLRLRARCGRYLYELADLRRAILLLESTLTDAERILGPDHPDTLTSRNNLADAYQSAGRLDRGDPPVRAHPRRSRAGPRRRPPRHPDLAQQPRRRLPSRRGDLDEAIPLYERTLADRERVLGADHPDTLTSRNNLAGAYESAGRPGRGHPPVRAHPGRPRAGPRRRPPRHPDLAQQPRRRLPVGGATWTRPSPCTSAPWPTASGSSAPTTPTP